MNNNKQKAWKEVIMAFKAVASPINISITETMLSFADKPVIIADVIRQEEIPSGLNIGVKN